MKIPSEGRVSHKQKKSEMKFLWQQLNISWGVDKFRNKAGNWTENIQRVEKDIPKVAVSYAVQEDEAEKGKVKLERK